MTNGSGVGNELLVGESPEQNAELDCLESHLERRTDRLSELRRAARTHCVLLAERDVEFQVSTDRSQLPAVPAAVREQRE